MCDHLGGVGGREDGRRQVHHGLHLQGDTHDEDKGNLQTFEQISSSSSSYDDNILRSLVVGNVQLM